MSRIKITSKSNPLFKEYKKLLTKKHRDSTNNFLVHGKHLVEEASKVNNTLIEVLTSNNNQSGTLLSKELMRELSIDNAYYDVIGVCRQTNENIKNNNKILVLDQIQDPSNVGALLRTALAFGFNEVYASQDTSDFYHERSIRASQGAIFKLALHKVDLNKLYTELRKDAYEIITADINGKPIESNNNEIEKVALVVGNEGQGVSDLTLHNSSKIVKITMSDEVESLNVAQAAAILMYLLK